MIAILVDLIVGNWITGFNNKFKGTWITGFNNKFNQNHF